MDQTGRKASEAWCPLARHKNPDYSMPANRDNVDPNELRIGNWNCCIGSKCAMWSISLDKHGEENGGVCGAALTGQVLIDA